MISKVQGKCHAAQMTESSPAGEMTSGLHSQNMAVVLFTCAARLSSDQTTVASAGGIPVWPGWRRWQVVTFRLQLVLHLFYGAIELLIFAFELFTGIIIDHDVWIDSVTFDDPLFAVFGIKRELRLEELAAVDKRQRFTNASY